MGLNFFSCSSFDWGKCNKNKNKNPNPKNYIIIKHSQINNFLILFINYPDCTNYEGNKILVFKDLHISDLKKIDIIDPHFSKNKPEYSPIARFIPNKEGWNMAITFCAYITDKNNLIL